MSPGAANADPTDATIIQSTTSVATRTVLLLPMSYLPPGESPRPTYISSSQLSTVRLGPPPGAEVGQAEWEIRVRHDSS